MPYYLCSSWIPDPIGRGTRPTGSDIAGANWIILNGNNSLLWRPQPLDHPDLNPLATGKTDPGSGAVRNFMRNLAGDGRTYPPGTTFEAMVVDLLMNPPADGRWGALEPSFKNQAYQIFLGPDTGRLFWSQPAVVPPSTVTYPDTFNRTNSSSLGTSSGAHFTWIEVQGDEWEINNNQAACLLVQTTSQFNVAATNTDVDSDVNYAKANVVAATRGSGYWLVVGLGITGNTFADSTNGHALEVGINNSNAIANRIYRWDTGANMDTEASTNPYTGMPTEIYVERDGSNIIGKIDGTTILGPTTSLFSGGAGNRKACITAYSNNDSETDGVTIDDFETGDIAAAGDVSISASSGSLVITGQTPTRAATAHVWESAQAASLVITGQTPSAATTAHVWESAQAASLVITGQTPTLTATGHQTISVDVASLVIGGQTPGVFVPSDQAISVDVASLVIGGQTPSLTFSSPVISVDRAFLLVDAQTGTLTWTDHHYVSANVASVVVTGQTPTAFSTGNDHAVLADVASLIITAGTPTAFIDSFRIDVPAASQFVTFVWNAVPGATGYKIGMDVDSGAPYAQEFDVGNVLSYTVGPQAGTFYFNILAYDGDGDGPWNDEIVWTSSGLILTGQQPTVSMTGHVTIAADAASLVLTGSQPSVGMLMRADVDVASLVIDGQQPTAVITANVWTSADVGDLVITGQQPTFAYTDHHFVQADAASLVIDGATPTVQEQGTFVISVPAADLTIDGQQVEIDVSQPAQQHPGGSTGRKYRRRARRRWILPNDMHVYGTEEEALAIAQRLTSQPVVVLERKPAAAPIMRADNGEAIPQYVYPVYRKRAAQSANQFAAITQLADTPAISPAAILEMINKQRRRRLAAALLLS